MTVKELDKCDPIKKVDDLWDNQKINLNNKKLDPEDPAIPCGLVAKSFFNDSFSLSRINPNN